MKKCTFLIAVLSALSSPAMATTFIAQYVRPPATNASIPGAPGAAPIVPIMPPGLSVQVLEGTIALTNGGGAQQFTTGQFGFTPSFQTAPVVVPPNPGLQFIPPPAFAVPNTASGSSTAAKADSVNCEVR